MKTIYNKIFFLALFFAICGLLPAQKRVVKIDGITPPDGTLIYDQIYKAITEDAPNRATNNNVVYELKRGQVYLATSTINATDFDLHIRAEEGTGPKPLILHTLNSAGSSASFINAYKNLTLENIEFDGRHANGSIVSAAINMRGLNCRFIVKGCWITSDLSAAVRTLVDHTKVYISDCIFGNLGHWISVGGNGRALDVRAPNNVDTIVFENSTFYNLTDRFLRNMAPVIDYFKMDHNSIVNMQGYHGCVQLGKTRTAEITNNIFANPLIYGNRLTARWRSEQHQPKKDFSVITHDSLSAVLPSATIVMRNNNIYHEQKFVDYFNQTPPDDSIKDPTAVSSYIVYNLGTDIDKAYFREELTFANTSSSDNLYDFLVWWAKYPKAGIFPNNFSEIYPYEWDVSYPTSSISYTAGDDGFPVGDLNAFPAKKALWLQKKGKIPVKNETLNTTGLEISKSYPNPFKFQTTINYSVEDAQKLEISIYNSYGKKIKVLANANIQAGDYQISWDGTDNSGSDSPNGLYLIQISGSNGSVIKKIVKN